MSPRSCRSAHLRRAERRPRQQPRDDLRLADDDAARGRVQQLLLRHDPLGDTRPNPGLRPGGITCPARQAEGKFAVIIDFGETSAHEIPGKADPSSGPHITLVDARLETARDARFDPGPRNCLDQSARPSRLAGVDAGEHPAKQRVHARRLAPLGLGMGHPVARAGQFLRSAALPVPHRKIAAHPRDDSLSMAQRSSHLFSARPRRPWPPARPRARPVRRAGRPTSGRGPRRGCRGWCGRRR